jgi:hypothetical protein
VEHSTRLKHITVRLSSEEQMSIIKVNFIWDTLLPDLWMTG